MYLEQILFSMAQIYFIGLISADEDIDLVKKKEKYFFGVFYFIFDHFGSRQHISKQRHNYKSCPPLKF
jgi:hypothetical protein